jgi:hypothetical protein
MLEVVGRMFHWRYSWMLNRFLEGSTAFGLLMLGWRIILFGVGVGREALLRVLVWIWFVLEMHLGIVWWCWGLWGSLMILIFLHF